MTTFVLKVIFKNLFFFNCTDETHEWFQKSRDVTMEGHEYYKDFYVWDNTGSDTVPPNNWVGFLIKSCLFKFVYKIYL